MRTPQSLPGGRGGGPLVPGAVAALAVVLALAGCGGAAPDGSPTSSPSDLGQVGDGTVLESEWTYAVGPDDGGWCTRLDVAGSVSTRCGDLLPADEDAFGEVGRGPAGYEEAQAVEGFVTDEAATVWLIGEADQYRIPAVIMPLGDVGIDGAQAYVGFARADVTLTHLQAVAINGDVLQTYEFP